MYYFNDLFITSLVYRERAEQKSNVQMVQWVELSKNTGGIVRNQTALKRH